MKINYSKSIFVDGFGNDLEKDPSVKFSLFKRRWSLFLNNLSFISERKYLSYFLSSICIFENPNIQTKSIYSVRNLSDWNDSKLMRSRGGLIAAATKGRKDIFDKNHFIFPVKSIDGSRSRFLYKSTLGHTIIKNYKNYKK